MPLQLSQHFSRKHSKLSTSLGGVTPPHQALSSHPSWLRINPDDQDKDFQACRVKLCQHQITQPPPSPAKHQDRASGTPKHRPGRGSIGTSVALGNGNDRLYFRNVGFFNHLNHHTLQGFFLLLGVYAYTHFKGSCMQQRIASAKISHVLSKKVLHPHSFSYQKKQIIKKKKTPKPKTKPNQ